MIKNFGDKETEKKWDGIRSKKLPDEIQNIARRKLRMIKNAQIGSHGKSFRKARGEFERISQY